ncbi:hypothetical protein PHMEG_0009340 [Phytophthora megakarya]|uniref:SWIM-type domain-containing protein n=1 Tax=Phytophthora megakarya TaxID=4795 RepID=A0A225WIX0_9STRA|nr:hypothetical protein PHMEG_0009340 [Phytophthora megakarya]
MTRVYMARTTKYAKHPNGILHFEDKVEDIQLSYQSLHAVDAEHHRALFHDWASPIWTGLEIRLVRNRFKCDCKMFCLTGWHCCHVLECIHLVSGVDFSMMLKRLPARRTSGHPK